MSDSRVVDLLVLTDTKEILSALSDLHKKIGASKLVVLIGR